MGGGTWPPPHLIPKTMKIHVSSLILWVCGGAPHWCCFHWCYIVFSLFVTVFFVFQCFKALLHRLGRNGIAGAQLCRAGWVMCQFDERGGVVAETWRSLRVPDAPLVKPGAAYCYHCLFAWSPSGIPTSPGPRRRLFNNDGSVAARRSVTVNCVLRRPPNQTSRTNNTQAAPCYSRGQSFDDDHKQISETSPPGWHKVGTRFGTRLAQG